MTSALVADFEARFPGGPALRVALTVPADTFSVTVLFGPSGAGKTTVLRCLAGLHRPSQGVIRFGEEVWDDVAARAHLAPQDRRVGYVSQDYALFPHLTVAGNIAYSLSGIDVAERRRRVAEMVELFGLAGLEERRPRQVSSGQQQRAALARALVRRPRLLLLDEPLAALDAPTREQLRRELRRLLGGMGVPVLLVTHDRIETQALGDTVVVLDGGRVRQSGPVPTVFAHPADAAVARIVGVDTVEPARILSVADGLATITIRETRLLAPAPKMAPGEQVCACVRAENVSLGPTLDGSAGTMNQLPGRVRSLTHEGAQTRLELDCGFPLVALVGGDGRPAAVIREGDAITAHVAPSAIQLLPR